MSADQSRSAALLALSGCNAFGPAPHEGAPFHQRMETKEDPDFRVSAVALSGEEARRLLGVGLEAKGVRAVWVEIENRSDQGAWYFPIGADPAFFASYEVVYMFHRWWAGDRNQRIAEHLLKSAMPLELPARGTARGFVSTHDGEGTGYVRIDVVDDAKVREFRFISHVPGERWDFQRVDFVTPYPESQVRDLDYPTLLAELEKRPCCAADEKGRPVADPLNMFLFGRRREVAFPLVQRGWNLTEPFDVQSAWKSVKAFVRGTSYRTSPVGPLHLFGRPQDAALQKPGNDIDRRNHLRVWLAPFTLDGRPGVGGAGEPRHRRPLHHPLLVPHHPQDRPRRRREPRLPAPGPADDRPSLPGRLRPRGGRSPAGRPAPQPHRRPVFHGWSTPPARPGFPNRGPSTRSTS